MSKRTTLLISYILSVMYAFAQGPGGVSGAELWHIATATTNNTDSSYVWRDCSGDSTRFISIENDHLIVRPQSELQSFNFHPALHFDSISGKSLLRHTNLAQTTLIGVFAPDSVQLFQINANPIELYHTNGRAGEVILTSTDSVHDESLVNLPHKYNDGRYAPFNETALRTITYERANIPNHSVWGELGSSSLLFNANGRPFTGYSPEMIVYGRMLSQLERRKVETYLAIKYGITLWGSYISPDGRLIWDNSDAAYHHRVAAIAKYSGSSLSQMLSTTSYEEGTLLSVLSSNDTFYKHGTFSKPTPNRLLVLGHEYGYSLPDNSYMIWGDDSLSLSLSGNADSLWHIMGRSWKLNSNMPSGSDNSVTVTASNINVTRLRDGWYSINRPRTSSAVSYLRLGPKTSNDLHYSFFCPESHPSFDIGITTSGNTVLYGYRVDSLGNIKKIEGSRVSSEVIYNGANGHQVDFYKKGDDMFLQIDGQGVYGYYIKVPVRVFPIIMDSIGFPNLPFNPFGGNDQVNGDDVQGGIITPIIDDRPGTELVRSLPKGYSCYGLFAVTGSTPLDIKSFRADGFSNTGNQIELNYNIANGLKRFRKKRSILLINESPVFGNPEEVDQRIPCSEFDVDRHKLLFHNVFFNENDTSYFTFGAYDGLIADFKPVRANCGGDDQPTNTGRLIIDIKCGSPLYYVKMDKLAPNNMAPEDTLLLTGTRPYDYLRGITFGTDHFVVDSIEPGGYDLTLAQRCGKNIYASPYPGSSRYYSSTVPNDGGVRSVSWFVTDTLSNYKAGFITGGNAGSATINAGFQIDGSKAFYLNNDTVVGIIDKIAPGDSLAVSIDTFGLHLTYNNSTHDEANSGAMTVFKAEFQCGEATLAGVKYTNGAEIPDDSVSDESVLVEYVSPYTITKRVYIGYECDTTTRNEVIDISGAAMNQAPRKPYDDSFANQTNGIDETAVSDGALKVTPQGGQSFTAELTTSDSGIAQLLVFDTMGRMIAEGTMTGSSVKTASFSVPAFGVYIVKVLTDHEEYSEKILCK